MRIVHTYSGDTLIVSPLAKRKDKLPFIKRLIVKGSETYAVTNEGHIAIGTIPEGFKLERMNKYNEIVFKNASLKPRKKRIHPLLKQKLNAKSNTLF